MKHTSTLLCALMLLTGIHAAAAVQTLVAADYSVRADATNSAMFYTLELKPEDIKQILQESL